MGSDLKEWKCRNGHVLGMVQHVQVIRTYAGQPLRYRSMRLMLYRHAVDLGQDAPAEVEVMANVEGTTLDVRCDSPGCDAVRSWFEGEAALEALLAAVKRQ